MLRAKASPVVHARRRLDHLALALQTPFLLGTLPSVEAAARRGEGGQQRLLQPRHPIFWRKKMNSHIIIFLINIVAPLSAPMRGIVLPRGILITFLCAARPQLKGDRSPIVPPSCVFPSSLLSSSRTGSSDIIISPPYLPLSLSLLRKLSFSIFCPRILCILIVSHNVRRFLQKKKKRRRRKRSDEYEYLRQ